VPHHPGSRPRPRSVAFTDLWCNASLDRFCGAVADGVLDHRRVVQAAQQAADLEDALAAPRVRAGGFAGDMRHYLPSAAGLVGHGFELLPTGQRPHYTVRLRRADHPELDLLLAALGDLQPNPQYAKGGT
jgi:hypothetical protein